jgi:hypothetical protein
MTALLPTDGCPRCITPDPVHPFRLEFTDDRSGLAAWYRCPSCGYSWVTGWDASALDLPCPGCPVCGTAKEEVA